MQKHLWLGSVLQELIEYSFLNGLREAGTALMVAREIADEEIRLNHAWPSSNIITFPSVPKLLAAVGATPAEEQPRPCS